MNKIMKVLLEDFKKSSKSRKLTLAKRYGFNTSADYLGYLLSTEILEKYVTPIEKPTIHNVVLLDASFSMSGCKYENAKKGIFEELVWLKSATDVKYTITVQEFVEGERNNSIKTVTHSMMADPKEVEDYSFNGPTGNNTPLYKAVLDIITEIQTRIKATDKVLLKVYTDGANNTHIQYTNICANKIKEVQKENFTVTFVGTKKNLDHIKFNLDLEDSNCLAIDNSGEGFREAFDTSLKATQRYTKSVVNGEDVSRGFYKTIIK